MSIGLQETLAQSIPNPHNGSSILPLWSFAEQTSRSHTYAMRANIRYRLDTRILQNRKSFRCRPTMESDTSRHEGSHTARLRKEP